jgi:hypothetical protein
MIYLGSRNLGNFKYCAANRNRMSPIGSEPYGKLTLTQSLRKRPDIFKE